MAETRLTNAVIPSVFTQYTIEPSIYKSRLFRSGVIQENAQLSALLAGGGLTYQLPFWQDVAGGSGDVPSETVAATVNNLAALRQTFRRQFREKAWGANDLVTVEAGSDPLAALSSMVQGYWAQAYDQLAVATLRGVIADNIANDSGDLVNDISSATGAAAVFSSDAVIDAQAKLGENGNVAEGDVNGGGYVAILVHPLTLALMRKQNAIDYLPMSEQERPIPFYMGMRVIEDRNAYVNTAVYDSYIFKAGALQFGQSSAGYLPTETDRDPSTGFGIDKLYTRRVFGMHPVGFRWTENTVTDNISPSDANLVLAANWDRVFNKENAGFVVLRHRIAAA